MRNTCVHIHMLSWVHRQQAARAQGGQPPSVAQHALASPASHGVQDAGAAKHDEHAGPAHVGPMFSTSILAASCSGLATSAALGFMENAAAGVGAQVVSTSGRPVSLPRMLALVSGKLITPSMLLMVPSLAISRG